MFHLHSFFYYYPSLNFHRCALLLLSFYMAQTTEPSKQDGYEQARRREPGQRKRRYQTAKKRKSAVKICVSQF